MTDYVAAIQNPSHVCHREALRLVEKFKTEATITDGVMLWNSNGSVPPQDCIELAAHVGMPIDVAKCVATRDEQNSQFIAAYRERMKNHVPSDEERFEMRAAFGPGETVVNVITGQTYRT